MGVSQRPRRAGLNAHTSARLRPVDRRQVGAAPMTWPMLCRVAGLPIAALDPLRAPMAAALVTKLSLIEERIAAQKDPVSRHIGDAVPQAGIAKDRRALLRARRDLFNERAPRSELLDAV